MGPFSSGLGRFNRVTWSSSAELRFISCISSEQLCCIKKKKKLSFTIVCPSTFQHEGNKSLYNNYVDLQLRFDTHGQFMSHMIHISVTLSADYRCSSRGHAHEPKMTPRNKTRLTAGMLTGPHRPSNLTLNATHRTNEVKGKKQQQQQQRRRRSVKC